MKRLGTYLLRNPLNAAWIALVLSLLPFLGLPTGWMAMVVIGLVTLRLGLKYGVFVLIWAALPGFALAYLDHPSWLINTAVLHGGLTLILACVLRWYRSWENVLEVAAVMGVIAVIVLHISLPDLHQWWQTQLTQVLQNETWSTEINTNAARTKDFINTASSIATGTIVAFMVFMNLLNLFFARWWQAAMFNPGGLRKEIYGIRIHKWAAISLMLCFLGLFLQHKLFIDTLPIALLPFILAGLSLLHVAVYYKKVKKVMLWVVYLLLLLVFPYVATLIALFGFADTWFNFREKIMADL